MLMNLPVSTFVATPLVRDPGDHLDRHRPDEPCGHDACCARWVCAPKMSAPSPYCLQQPGLPTVAGTTTSIHQRKGARRLLIMT